MKLKLIRPLLLPPVLILWLVACGTSATPVPAATATPDIEATVEAADTPTPIAKAVPTATPAPTATPVPTTTQGSELMLVLDRGSVARYLVTEQLARRKLPNDAVGETKEINGSIALTDKGAVNAAKSNITVSLASLKTDEERRDRYVRENTLKTSLYPKASVKIKKIERLSWPFPSSGKHTFQLITDTTIQGITATLLWETVANFDGDKITGKAKTNFPFETFDLKKPTLFFILSVENNIRLEIDFIATISEKP